MGENTSRLVLHIGPHKTATTYCQENFFGRRGRLKACGWMYPPIGRASYETGHHWLAHTRTAFLHEPGKARASLSHLGRRARTNGFSLFFSAEGFSKWAAQDFQHMATMLGYAEIELIFALRDPIASFASYWAEEVKHGYSTPLPDRFAAQLADPQNSALLNPMMALRPLMEAPQIRLHIVPFDILARRQIDIFTHICTAVLGIPEIRPRYKSPANTRLPIELTEFLRLLMQMGKARGGEDHLRKAFMHRISPHQRANIVRFVAAEAGHAKRSISMPAKAQFRAQIEAEARDELTKYLTLDPGNEPLFEARDETLAYYADAQLWQCAPVRLRAEEILQKIAS
ncbi:MAG: hypothetical protein ACRBBK_04005 [Paracoccaceae bacterium]